MEIIVAEHAGFCFGVKRSLEMAEEALAKRGHVYCLGELIHNSQVVADLEVKGLRVVSSLDAVPEGAVAMIRAHGAGPAAYEVAQARNITLLDATCPFVRRAQKAAADLAEEGYQVLVVGERDHPEARGIVEHTGGRATVVENPAETDGMELTKRIGIVAQTTQSAKKLGQVVARVIPRARDVKIANTICDATSHRQGAALEIARGVDVMLVIGGRHSANTTRLADLCADICPRTHHIESADEIEADWLTDASRVGITGGASTPVAAIEAVVRRVGTCRN
ncbi:MAG: 4-hydroxy-3-methylbut-2-enyl diphosphate reductase [Armatimonadetes bacterium]|nr:4-hydroxy-3-methylbut-2-enyl diphosphate reductase [Armatimonadota bacterium]